MTLIVTIATSHRVFQVSDRRFTWNNKVRPYTDEENKAIFMMCRDAHSAISYTGLGRIDTGKGARVRIDKWFTDYIIDNKMGKLNFDTICFNLTEHLTGLFRTRTYNQGMPLAIIFAGYKYPKSLDEEEMKTENDEGLTIISFDRPKYDISQYLRTHHRHLPYAQFICRVANFGGFRGECMFEGDRLVVSDEFKFDCMGISPRSNKAAILIDGAVRAINQNMDWELQGLARMGFFHAAPDLEICTRLVSFIQKASDRPEGLGVGKSCMSMVITQHLTDELNTFFFSPLAQTEVRYPIIIKYDMAYEKRMADSFKRWKPGT